MKNYSIVLLIFIIGCASTNLTYFDNTTYKNLTELKPMVTHLYDEFKKEDINLEKIDEVWLKLDQCYEYEKVRARRTRELYFKWTRSGQCLKDMQTCELMVNNGMML